MNSDDLDLEEDLDDDVRDFPDKQPRNEDAPKEAKPAKAPKRKLAIKATKKTKRRPVQEPK